MAMRQNASTGELVEEKSADSKSDKQDENILHIKVWSPFKVYFDGSATSISAVNGTGAFDILAKHHNFITLLNPCDMVLQTNQGEVRIKISGGVMQVRKNAVIVFLQV